MICPRISDHALLRWLERAHGVDIEGFRRLMAAEIEHSLDTEGTRRVHFGPAFVISADGECVVTYLPEGWQRSPLQSGVAIARHVGQPSRSEAA